MGSDLVKIGFAGKIESDGIICHAEQSSHAVSLRRFIAAECFVAGISIKAIQASRLRAGVGMIETRQ